jgi:hypothetical protein
VIVIYVLIGGVWKAAGRAPVTPPPPPNPRPFGSGPYGSGAYGN